MFQNIDSSAKRRFFKPKEFSCFFQVSTLVFWLAAAAFSQPQTVSAPPTEKTSSVQNVGQDGMTVEQFVESGQNRRADLQAARQRLAIAEARLRQARFRPNTTLDAEFGSPRFVGGEAESDFSVGVRQVFELSGKRQKRVAVAELELNKIRAEVLTLERAIAAEIRHNYTNALAFARQLDVLEKRIAADEEITRVTEARLKEGDVAPLNLNLVRVEADAANRNER